MFAYIYSARIMKMFKAFFKKVVPWVVTILLFAYLFHKYPPQNIWNSLKSVNIWALFYVATGYFLIMYVIDTYAIARILRHFRHKAPFREILPARGLTYLLMIINYAASQIAFAFYQNRKHGLPISEMLGIFGIIVVIDLYILATLAFITTFFTSWPFEILGMNIAHFVRLFAIAGYALFIINLIFWHGTTGKFAFIDRLRKKDFFSVLSKAGLQDYLSVALWRLPVHAFIMVGMYFAIKPFHASIPFVNVLANIPLVFFIGALPISPGGLGTTNVALVELFQPFVTSPLISAGIISAGDLLFSFSLVWMFANYLMKALTGAICLKFVSKKLFEPTADLSEKMAIPDAVHLANDL